MMKKINIYHILIFQNVKEKSTRTLKKNKICLIKRILNIIEWYKIKSLKFHQYKARALVVQVNFQIS